MYYCVFINGADIEKKFARDFINYVVGGDCDNQIEWNRCTRKRLAVTSKNVVERLERVNGTVYWPSGKPFRCRRVRTHDDKRRQTTTTTTRHLSPPISSSQYFQYPRRSNYEQRCRDNDYNGCDRDRCNCSGGFRRQRRRQHSVDDACFSHKKQRQNQNIFSDALNDEKSKLLSKSEDIIATEENDWYTNGFIDVKLGEEDEGIERDVKSVHGLNDKIKQMYIQ
ncbi:lef6 [Artaxa digramma nucleopolyhedrovirus]|uniref:Lef6 n=1 Tax=Artaxa digramma nucleopolyhedrovirus TaxID=3070910 RepID=A0AAE6V0G3_9ABAC|nr:lef6 [Euproctis digramma nucleopolyhedrovirus]QHB21714.1 lef6 [Artaxa digramma nucleopolyhedrovirus]